MPQQTLEWWQKEYFYDADPIKASVDAVSWHVSNESSSSPDWEKRFFVRFEVFSFFAFHERFLWLIIFPNKHQRQQSDSSVLNEFLSDHQERAMPSAEKQDRKWIISQFI